MCTFFDYFPFIHDNYHIGILNSGKTMGYDNGGASLHHVVQSGLHSLLRLVVESRCRLVKYHYWRIAQNSTRYAYTLTLTAAERTAMVTDALAVAASDSNTAFDPRVIIEDGVCKLADRSALAGSIATMDRLIATAVHLADIPLQDACRMVAETPARIMGVYDRKGSLQRGKDADILIFDDNIKLHSVYCMGNRVDLEDKPRN